MIGLNMSISNFVVVCPLHFVISKQTRSQAGFLHFSPRSRDQLKAHVFMYHHRLPSPAPSLVSKAASTKSAACCRMEYGIVPVSPIGTTGSFPRMDSTGRT